MSDTVETELHLEASRWRFFITTAWSSLSIDIMIYVLTRWLDIPYGWAVFIVVLRALFWATTIDIRNLDVRVDANSFTGPCMLFSSDSRTLLLRNVCSDSVFELFGVFSIEDSDGNEIWGHYSYYSRLDREFLREFIQRLR